MWVPANPGSSAISAYLVACNGGVHQAEILATPFPGHIAQIDPIHTRCRATCRYRLTVRIQNPTDRNANVQECSLDSDPSVKVYGLGFPAGLYIAANGEADQLIQQSLPFKPSQADALVGASVSCVGLDWHGHPPI